MKMEARVARLKASKKEKKTKVKIETAVTEEVPCSSKSQPETSSKPKTLITLKPTLSASKRELVLDPLATDPNAKKVKKDYSIASDPKATEVFKSIFTSHESEKKQDRAHWITFNPHYY